jgi:hypothetical protein
MGYIGADMGDTPENPTSGTSSSWRTHKPVTLRRVRARNWVTAPGTEADDIACKLVTYAPTTFEACELEGYHAVQNFAGDGMIRFVDCVGSLPAGVFGDSSYQHRWGWQPENGWPKVRIEGTSRSLTSIKPGMRQQIPGFAHDSFSDTMPARVNLQPGSRRFETTDDGVEYAVKDNYTTSVPAAASDYDHSTPTVLTFTADDGDEFFVGDFLYWKHVALPLAPHWTERRIIMLKVVSIDGDEVTCWKLYRDADFDETYEPAEILIAPNIWAPSPALGLNADLVNLSTALANMPSGFHEAIRVGDFIRGAGIPDNARIATVPGYLSDHFLRAYLGKNGGTEGNGPIITDFGASDGFDGYGAGIVPELTGLWRLLDGQVRGSGSVPSGLGFKMLWDVHAQDVVFEFEVVAHTGASSGGFFRYLDDDNFCQVAVGANSISVFEMVAGVGATTGSGGTGMTIQAGDVIRVEAVGTACAAKVMRGGVQVGNTWNTSPLTPVANATKVGLRHTSVITISGFVRCIAAGTPLSPQLNKAATATASNVPLSFAELVELGA